MKPMCQALILYYGALHSAIKKLRVIISTGYAWAAANITLILLFFMKMELKLG